MRSSERGAREWKPEQRRTAHVLSFKPELHAAIDQKSYVMILNRQILNFLNIIIINNKRIKNIKIWCAVDGQT